ncbi:hypothetical protein AVEN_22921-1 [Araneus ventricosus]|uniref:Uncharacterized protein n=1 Tax=Araneus ventricosus TaxID=182803 RepID=A0A4Y2D749_ARAVE|nr:hypothetical protein AVEN_22921-1 [Araneus ventricosus]
MEWNFFTIQGGRTQGSRWPSGRVSDLGSERVPGSKPDSTEVPPYLEVDSDDADDMLDSHIKELIVNELTERRPMSPCLMPLQQLYRLGGHRTQRADRDA